jgi:hypothetical protein
MDDSLKQKAITDHRATCSRYIERTDRWCEEDGRAKRVRSTLLLAEKRVHQDGWDNPDACGRLFAVYANPDSTAVRCEWMNVLTDGLRTLIKQHDGNVGISLQHIAEVVEMLRHTGLDEENSPLGFGLAPPPEDEDMFQHKNWPIYGFGVLSEGWLATARNAAEGELLTKLTEARQLDRHPDRVSMRCMWMTARDGWTWMVERVQGDQPVSYASTHDDDLQQSGNILNALGRTLNAITATTTNIPVSPRFPPRETPSSEGETGQ